ncbi:MAG: TolB-like 6-bladed beta-propeller domain-containing protein [Tannerellaceae bacterium]|jgi:hypothetical protein|nr:TolB-like 6-bladed beta-propeller domain-containing protein [Tannerellaceae bacterium]
MERQAILFILNLLIIFFPGCSNENKIKQLDFKIQEDIECISIPYQDILGITMQLQKKDNLLFLNDFRGDTLIHIYDVRKQQLLRKMIPVGSGPKELMSPVEIHVDKEHLFIFYRQTSLMYSIPLDSVMNGNKDMVKNFQVPDGANLLFPINDSLFISSGFFEKRYVLFNHSGELIHEFGEYPAYWDREKHLSYRVRAMFHQTSFEKHPSAPLFLTYSPHVFEIYDYSAGISTPTLVKRMCIGNYNYLYTDNETMLAVESGMDVEKGIISVSCSSKHIYILYDYDNAGHENPVTKIQVIDWNGNPVKLLNLPKRGTCLHIDEEEEIGYMIVEDPDDTLMYFNLGQ